MSAVFLLKLSRTDSVQISLLSDRSLASVAKKELLSLRQAQRALKRLQSSLNAKIGFMERSVTPAVLHRGVESLPDEILARIFLICADQEASGYNLEFQAMVYRSGKRNKCLKRLGSVNSRFRVWARCMSDVMKANDETDVALHVSEFSEISQLQLQRLTNLEVQLPIYWPEDNDQLNNFPAAVTKCSLLRRLRLELKFQFLPSEPFKYVTSSLSVHTLPRLESFAIYSFVQVDAQERECVSRAMSSLFTSLSMPKLRSLSIDVFDNDPYKPWTSETEMLESFVSWDSFFPPSRAFPHLRKLSFSAKGATKKKEDTIICNDLFPGLLEHFPGIESFTLEPAEIAADCPDVPALARLRELTLRDCRMETDDIEAFLRALFEQEEVNVERITIASGTDDDHCDSDHASSRSSATSGSYWTDRLRATLKKDFVVELI